MALPDPIRAPIASAAITMASGSTREPTWEVLMNEDADLPIADQADSHANDAVPQADTDPELDAKGVSRRQMLIRSVAVMGGAMAAGVGVPAIFYIAGPAAEDSSSASA